MSKNTDARVNSRDWLFIINNLIIFITTAIAVPVTLIIGSRTTRLDNSPYPYWEHIVSFTLLSGIFLGIVAGISAFIVLFSKMRNIQTPCKKGIKIWYLIASTASMITCLTVLLFLAPTRAIKGGNYFDPLLETMFFLHLFNPILSAITYIFGANDSRTKFVTRFLAILPIVAYSIPYILCVVILKIWPDFYGLTFGGRYYLLPIIFLVFATVSFLIANVLDGLHNKYIKSE